MENVIEFLSNELTYSESQTAGNCKDLGFSADNIYAVILFMRGKGVDYLSAKDLEDFRGMKSESETNISYEGTNGHYTVYVDQEEFETTNAGLIDDAFNSVDGELSDFNTVAEARQFVICKAIYPNLLIRNYPVYNRFLLIRNGQPESIWQGFKELCQVYDLPYHTLRAKSFPRIHNEFEIRQLPFRRVGNER